MMPAQPEAHILIVDDDERIRELLKKFLSKNGFFTTAAADAAQARRLLAGLEFDLIVLDVMMPGEDGISFTENLRKKITTPILLLTAKAGPDERILGLEAGADDYLTKPFEPKELVLRINAILRRVPAEQTPEAPSALHLGHVRYDLVRGELWHGAEMIRLTATESVLMRIFSGSPNQPVDRTALVEELSRNGEKTQERAVDVQITRLRKKIELDPKNPRYLQTVRGAGYMLAPD